MKPTPCFCIIAESPKVGEVVYAGGSTWYPLPYDGRPSCWSRRCAASKTANGMKRGKNHPKCLRGATFKVIATDEFESRNEIAHEAGIVASFPDSEDD